MNIDLLNKNYDDLTIRDLRSLLFELDGQDKKVFDILFENINTGFKLQSQSSQDVSRYLFNFLYHHNAVSIECKVCGAKCRRIYYNNEDYTNCIMFFHDEDDEESENDCCLFYYRKEDEGYDYLNR